MKASVRHINPEDEFFISEGCHIIEVSNSADDPLLSIARARVEPGVTTRWHRLRGVSERYVILQGNGDVEVGNLARQSVKAGNVVLIPPDCPQRIANTGTTDLVFLAICTPRFHPEIYQALDFAAPESKESF